MQRRLGIDAFTGQPIEIEWSGSSLTRVASPAAAASVQGLPVLCPGFIDIQINGLAGVNFGGPELSTDDVARITGRLAKCGVTHFLPTLITDDVDRMRRSLERLADAATALDPALVGIHLEGPYLSREDGARGAHPLEHCKNPNWDEFQRLQEASGGRVRVVTLAPELPGAVEFIRRLAKSGVRAAIGHTSATRDEILAAVDAGASLATHLGNAVADRIQRHHNTIFDQLGEDRLWASLIVDGHHLPPHVVQIFLRAKGIEKTILVSDAVQYAGLPPGVYDGGYRKFEVRDDGFIGVVGEPRLAGSGLTLDRGIENLVAFTGVTFADALRTVTRNPAEWLGMDALGLLKPGCEASFVVCRWDGAHCRLTVEETIRAGGSTMGRGGDGERG